LNGSSILFLVAGLPSGACDSGWHWH
jgi:hypothetical protein